MSYGRILIHDLIGDEERVLYLDSDIVVDQDVSELFEIDLGNQPIAAVEDLLYLGNFNSGVLLFNMPVLRKHGGLVQQMMKYGLNNELHEGDQSVLNHFFKDTYLHLPLKYNLAISYDFLCTYYPNFNHNYFEKVNNTVGSIIHFTGPTKPWAQFSTSRFRQKWWQYYDLEWSEIINHQLPNTLPYHPQGEFLTFTNSQDLQNFESLVNAFPDCTFHVASWTEMGDRLTKLVQYPNVHLYPSSVRYVITQLVDRVDAYLDINQGNKDEDYLRRFQATGKSLFSFDGVDAPIKNAANYHSFADEDIAGMINAIKAVLNI